MELGIFGLAMAAISLESAPIKDDAIVPLIRINRPVVKVSAIIFDSDHA